MTADPIATTLTEASSSVHAHLSILQDIIVRMAGNSASCKTWCITIVSAILVVVAGQERGELARITLVPIVLFLALDAYYLGLEKAFRASYIAFLRKLHSGEASPEDLYLVESEERQSAHQFEALKSFSVWGFYVTLIVLVELLRAMVLD